MNHFDISLAVHAGTKGLARSVVMALFAAALCTSAGAAEPASTDYSGDVWTRSTLTGDWGGLRTDLANKGLTFDANLTNVVQGSVHGGKTHEWEYGGRSALHTTVDTQKLGLWPGGFFLLEVEGNWNSAITARETGALMPANSNQLYPEPTGDNFNVPQVAFAQFLSHYVGVMFGKLDTTSGDSNDFAHGKGDKQFMNLALNFNPTLLLVTPYSTLGAGLIVLPTADPEAAIVTFNVLQSNGRASTPGFDDLSADKLTFSAAGRVRTGFFGKTGHQVLGAEYSNRDFTSLDQRIGDILEGGTIAEEDGSWNVYYNFDQYVYQPDKTADRGVGVFGRIGISDGNPNLAQSFLSLGFGGKGPCASRPHDGFGIGGYFIDIDSPSPQGTLATLSFLRDEYGLEAYYGLAITPWMVLTFDVQVVRPSQKERISTGENVDTATIFGVRQEFVF